MCVCVTFILTLFGRNYKSFRFIVRKFYEMQFSTFEFVVLYSMPVDYSFCYKRNAINASKLGLE